MAKTHKEIVKEILEQEGEIHNLWCWQNGIWRLSDIIFQLRTEGMNIETIYMKEGVGRNCHYRLIKNDFESGSLFNPGQRIIDL